MGVATADVPGGAPAPFTSSEPTTGPKSPETFWESVEDEVVDSCPPSVGASPPGRREMRRLPRRGEVIPRATIGAAHVTAHRTCYPTSNNRTTTSSASR